MKMTALKDKLFGELDVGDVFIFNHITWMKTNPILLKQYINSDSIGCNAIMLDYPYAYGEIGWDKDCKLVGRIETMTNPVIAGRN